MCDTQAPNLPSVCVSLFLFLSLSRFTHSLSMFMLIDAFLFYGICVSTGEPLTHSLLTNIHIHAHMCVYENEWEEKRYLSRDFLRSWPYGFRFTRTLFLNHDVKLFDALSRFDSIRSTFLRKLKS